MFYKWLDIAITVAATYMFTLGMVSVLTVATAFVLQLMQDLGVIHQASPGAFHLLPLGERSLQKLIRIVDDEMGKINAQKLLLPLLTSGELWKSTGMSGGHHAYTSVIALHQPTNHDLIQKYVAIYCHVYVSDCRWGFNW
jgi:prolyl-tRNA synthetase